MYSAILPLAFVFGKGESFKVDSVEGHEDIDALVVEAVGYMGRKTEL